MKSNNTVSGAAAVGARAKDRAKDAAAQALPVGKRAGTTAVQGVRQGAKGAKEWAAPRLEDAVQGAKEWAAPRLEGAVQGAGEWAPARRAAPPAGQQRAFQNGRLRRERQLRPGHPVPSSHAPTSADYGPADGRF